jgi:hypothetical protein
VCSAAQCQPNIESWPGCAANTNCCAGPGGGYNCNDAAPTTAAVQAIAAAGFPVYVVGVPGSAPYASLLDTLATAGGTARDPTGPGPQYYDVATTDEPAFQATLFSVAAHVAGHCTLTLDQVPPNPGLVNVFIDEQPLATGPGCILADSSESGADADAGDDAGADESGSDVLSSTETGDESGSDVGSPMQSGAGDTLFDGSSCNWVLQGQTVTILGSTCQSIMNGDVLDVRVVAGCPTVIR